jgi:hypothetical protein
MKRRGHHCKALEPRPISESEVRTWAEKPPHCFRKQTCLPRGTTSGLSKRVKKPCEKGSLLAGGVTKPLDEAMYPFFNLGLWIVPEQLARLRDVSIGLRYVPRLQTLTINLRGGSKFLLQQLD